MEGEFNSEMYRQQPPFLKLAWITVGGAITSDWRSDPRPATHDAPARHAALERPVGVERRGSRSSGVSGAARQ